MKSNTELLHVGVAKAVNGPGYVISAEYVEGYKILGHYKTFAAAKAALPRIKQFYGEELNKWKANLGL